MNVLKRRALILALLVLCLIGMTILGASAAVDTTTATTTQNADSVASATVKVGDAAPALYYYTDLATAIAEADENTTVTLLKDVTISAEIAVEKALTIDGNDFTVSTTATRNMFRVFASVNFVDVTITNTYANGRCIDTRTDDIEVNLTNVTLDTTGVTAGNDQPLTIGGSDMDGLTITLTNSTIKTSKSGYAAIIFVPVELTITDSELTGFGVIYAQVGSAGSLVTVEGSTLTSNNAHSGESNSFAAIVFEESGVELSLSDSQVVTTATGDQAQSAFGMKNNAVADITIDAATTFDIADANDSSFLAFDKANPPSLNVAADNAAVKELLNNEGFVAEDYNNDGVLDVAPPVEEGKAYVARVGTDLYTTLADAIAAAQDGDTVYMLKDTSVSDKITIAKALTIEGGNFTISTAARTVFSVEASVTFQNLNMVSTYTGQAGGRFINIAAEDIVVNFNKVAMDATASTPNPQPITVIAADATVNLTNCTIAAGKSGYAIISFYPVTLNITGSELTGYGTIYMKGAVEGAAPGASGSVIAVADSTLKSVNENSGESNSFAAVVFETSGVSISFTDSEIITEATGDQAQYAFSFDGEAALTIDANTTIDVAANNGSAMLSYNETAVPTLNVAAGNAAVKELLNNEGFVAEDYNNDGVLDVAPPVEEGKTYVARVGTVLYTTLDAALAAAGNGDTVYVLADVTLDSAITINNEGIALTLDLGGKTITATKGAFILKAGTLTVQNGTIAAQNDAFVMGTKGLDPDPVVVLNFEESLTVTSQSDCCAVVYAGTLNTKGTLVSNSAVYCAIQGSGNPGNTGTAINVLGGSITAANTAAIYQPQDGALTISGGTVSGKTAVYVKAGSVNMTGGKLVATGDKAAYNPYNDGFYPTGDALVIDSAEGYAPVSTVVIKPEATFESANGSALGSFTNIADATPVVPDAPFVAKIGGNYYTTLADAIAAAQNGDTVYVLKNIENAPTTSYITKTITVEGVNADITLTSAAKAILFNIGDNGHLTVKNLKITSDNFVVFRQSTAGASASVTLESGAIVTNIDLAAYNDILVYNAGGANANLTVNIKAGASLITKSLSEVAPTYGTIYAGTGTSITVNVWGTLKNIAQAPAGKNAQVLVVKGKTNNATLNVYEGAVIEGTSDSTTYTGNYSGIVYFSEGTNVINITGGTVTINGATGFAYTGTKSTINISGGTINNTNAGYPMFFGGNQTLNLSKAEGATLAINNKGQALLKSGNVYATFEDDATAISYGMTIRVGAEGSKRYTSTLATAFAMAADGDTLYVLSGGTVAASATLTGKSITITGTESNTTLNVSGAITLGAGATLTVKDLTVNAAGTFVSTAAASTLKFDTVTVANSAAKNNNFISVSTNGKLTADLKNFNYSSTNATRVLYVTTGGNATPTVNVATITNACFVRVENNVSATLGSPDAPASFTDVEIKGGTFFYAYTGSVYANIFGGSMDGALLYGGDNHQVIMNVKFNPTGDKTTTVTRATSGNSVYSAWVHLNPGGVRDVAISFRNFQYVDSGAGSTVPMLSVRNTTNLSISVENSTFTLGGKKLGNIPAACGVAFNSDAVAKDFGYMTRTSAGKYFTNIVNAANSANTTETTTIYVLADQTTANLGLDNPNFFTKKIHITSAEGGPYTVTGVAGAILFYLGGGAEVTFTNITYVLPFRFARIDGDCTVTFGAGAVMDHLGTGSDIFIYNNGNCTEAPTYTIDIQKGATIKSAKVVGNGLIYFNGANTAGTTVILKIAGTITYPSAVPIIKDVDSKGKHIVYYDAANAKVEIGTTSWFGNAFRQVGSTGGEIAVYAKGFASTADAAKWGYDTSSNLTAMTYNADPAAEWNYTYLTYGQLVHLSYNVLNSHGGEMWMLRNAPSIYQTQAYKNLGTVIVKSYNGAKITSQSATRFRVIGTTLVLDGIEVVLTGGGDFGIHAGTAEAPSVLKLINGAKITVSGSTATAVKFMSDGNDLYTTKSNAHLIVEAGSSIAASGTVLTVPSAWSGSVTINGTISGSGTLLSLASDSHVKATISESLFAATPHLTVSDGTSYYTTLKAALDAVPAGGSATLTLLTSLTTDATFVIGNKNVTITVAEGATLNYTGTTELFQIDNLGTLTFKDITVNSTGALVRYLGTSSELAQADRDIVINFVNATVNVTGSAVSLITSNAHFGSDNTKKCDSVTTNVDADSVINFTTDAVGEIRFISYNHNTHANVVANIDGAINITVTGDSESAFYVIRSNNPSSTIINVTKTASIVVTLPDSRKNSGLSYFTSCTGGNTETNKLNLHADAITENGALTLGGIRMFAAWTSACTFDVTVKAADATLDAVLGAWIGSNNNGGNVFTEAPLAFRTEINGEFVYGRLSTLIALAQDKATFTVVANHNVVYSTLLSGKEITLTAVEGVVITNTSANYFVRLGSNTVLNVENLKYQGNLFVSFTNSNGASTLNLNDGAIIEGGDPHQENGYIISDAGDAKGEITINVGAKAKLIRPASYTLSGLTKGTNSIIQLRGGSTSNVTINVYGVLANQTTIAAGAYTEANGESKPGVNATILSWNLPNATIIVNIYEGATVEGTSNDPQHGGNYSGQFYFAPNGNNTAKLNIYGGTIITHGVNPLAYFDAPTSYVVIDGAPTITMADLAYGMVRFAKTTGTSLVLGLDDGYSINLNGKEYYCGNTPVIFAISGITNEDAIAQGMLYCMDGVFYKSLADAIAMVPEGEAGTIELIANATLNTTTLINNKNITITAAEGVTLSYNGTGDFFQIENLGTLTFKDITVSSTSTLVRYLGTSSELAQADRDVVINFVNATVNVTGSAVSLITSNAHFGSDNTKKCDSVTTNIDADTVINFTTASTGEIRFISYNHNTHPNVIANINGTINITVTGDSASEAFYVVRSNNPSSTIINVTETASIVVVIPEGRKTSGKSYFTSCTGGTVNSNKLNIHADAITNEGALTLGGIRLFAAWTSACTFDVAITVSDTTLEATLLALTAFNSNAGTNGYEIKPVVFRTQVGDNYVYGTLNAVFAAAEANGTITLLANTTVEYSSTLSGKAITLVGAEGVTLNTKAAITLTNDASLTVKGLPIVTTTTFVTSSTATNGNTVKLENVVISSSAGKDSGFIDVAANSKLAVEISGGSITATGERIATVRLASANGKLTAMTVTGFTTNTTLIRTNTSTAVVGSATAPVVITDVTVTAPKGAFIYAYTGTIYADIFGGTFDGQFIYGGDGSTNTLGIRFNPTGEKTTTVSRDSSATSSVYSAWIHLNPNAVADVAFTLRNVTFTDAGVNALIAVRAAANLSISVENSTFTMSGAKLSSFPAASGVKFNSDTTARDFGYAARIGEEGGTYYKSVDKAAAFASATGTTTIYVVANHTTYNIGLDFPNHFAKKIHITSAAGATYTVTGAANTILFYLGGGAEVTFTNIIYDLPHRLARLDGSANITFGEGCVMNHLGGGAGIFIYNNGNAFADAEKTTLTTSMTNIIDIQKGATINAMVSVTANGLIYHNGDYAANAVNVIVKIAGTVKTANGTIAKDTTGTDRATYRVYVDAASAVIETGTAAWVGGKNAVLLYNGTFATTDEAIAWALSTGATAMTINNDPAAEYKYSCTYDAQFVPGQYKVLNSNGGEIWQLKSTTSTFATAWLIDLGTVTFKSYNGATIRFQDNAFRMRVENTTVIADGIEFITAGAAIKIHGGSEAKPSIFKMINGAKVTATGLYSGVEMISLNNENGGGYSHLYVDETSVISQTGTLASGSAYVIWAASEWHNGSITIKGTVSTNATAPNVHLIALSGNGTNALTLDGATLTNAGTGTLYLIEVLGGNTLEYENINDSVLTCSGEILTVLGGIIFKGKTAEEAAQMAADFGLAIGYNGVYSKILSTAIINQVPVGGKAEFQITGTLVMTSPIEIFDRDITLVGNNNAEYDLKFEGAADSVAFIIYSRGNLTFKNMNIWTKAQLVSYNANRKVEGDILSKNIVLNFVNTDVTASITSRYANDAGYAGALISSSNHFAENRGGCGEQSNSMTVNIDKDSSINFTTSFANAWMIAFNHNSHRYVYANIEGEVTMNATYAGTDANRTAALVKSNNPGRTEVLIAKTAKVKVTLNDSFKDKAEATFITSCTGGNATTNKLTIYLDAITENGALTLDGMMLYSGYTTSCIFTAHIIASDATMASTLTSWKAAHGAGNVVTPIVAYLEVDGEYHFSDLNGLVALIPVGGTGTIVIDNQIVFSSEISIVDRDITFIGSDNFTGDYHLKYTGTGYMFAIYSKGALTLKNIRIHTTGVLVDFNANQKVAGNKADKNTTIKLVNADVVAEGSRTYVFGSRNHYHNGNGCGEQANAVNIYIDADSSVSWTTSTTSNAWFLSFNHNTHVEMNAYIDGKININFTATALNAANEYSFYRVNNPTRTEVIISGTAKLVMNYTDDSINRYFGFFHTGTNKLFVDYNAIVENGAFTLDGVYLFSATVSCIPTLAIMNAPDTSLQNTIMSWQGYNASSKVFVTPIAFRSQNGNAYSYGCIGGAAYAAQDGAIITLLRPDFAMTPTTITNKTVTLMGLEDGYIIRNTSTGYLLNIGSGAHLTIVGLTFYGNRIARFTAAAGTTSSLTLGEGTSIIGGALEKDAYIFYGDSLKGATVITIEADASVIRPDTYTLTDAANPCPGIYRFQTSGAYTLNVYGELKNLTTIAPGVRALTQIGYCNSQNGMIVNIYDGAEIEGTSDSTAHKGYYQGIFYFAVYGANKHEFNIYGGTIVSHGMCSMIYFGNNYVTVRIKGTPTILMPDATYNMICLHNTKGAADSQTEFYADVEVGATIDLNGKAFFWHASTEVSEITAGKFFTDDNAASYGAGYRIIDENGLNRYVAGLGAAAAMSRNGGTIWLIGDVSDGGAGVVVNKYLFLKPVKPGYTITIGGSAPAIVINGGSATSPARFYIEDINFAGASTSTLFQVEGGGHAIIEMTNCNMNGGAGVIQMYDAAIATVTLTNGSYSMSAKPFYAIGYSDITVNATNITFTGTGTGDANSLFHLDGNAVGHWNIKGGSATTKWHTFYIRNVSTAFVNIEDFAIISDQWCFSSQSSSNWRVNLKNVDMVGKNCTATRMYGAAGSYVNIMGGSITSLKKDGTNPATMTFGNSIQVNIFDAYIHSAAMSAISGLAATVNINIYGGTYLYNGTAVSYAPIMLPKAGNLTVKGGTFINTNSTGPVFSNTAVSANKLLLEAYNAIGSSSYLVLNSSATGTPTTMLGAYGRASLNSLTMTRGAKPGNIMGIDPTKGEMTFKATVDKAAYEYMAGLSATGNVKFGMLVVPTALLNEGIDFTHFGLKNYTNIFGDNLELGVDYFDYTATATEEEDGCWTLKATHTGIDADNYNTKYSAVFYAEYEVTATDASGNAVVTGKTESGMDLTTAVVYRYADYDESDNARTLAEVAYAAYHDADNTYAGDKATLETWCGGDVAEKSVDIFLMAGGSNAAGNTPFSKEYAASLIDHVCANCGHVADEELFAAANYACVNELVHGKTLTVEDGNCICTCGFTCPENEAPADMKCPKTLTCGAAKATFQNVLKNPITNVFYSGIVSDAAGSKSASICSPVTLGLGWNGNMGPEFGMANELAKYYNATTPGKYAAIMKYAMNDAALVAEDAQFGNFSGKLYDSFIQMVEDQIGDYVNLGYKVNVAGFYWMQGEADIAVADAYAEALQKLIANVRADLAEITGDDMADLPVVVGEIATFTGAANSADRVALKNAQNTVTGVIIDNTSAYIADANGIFIDAQNVLDTGARVVAKILNATNADVVVPEIEATTEIIDPNGIEIPGHTSLAMSLIAAPSGSTITLKADQTVYASMTVADRDDLVVDGSGNTVTIVTDAPAFVLQGASVTLENIVVNHAGNAAAITLDNDSTLTVEEGAEITAKRTAIEMTGAASKLVVNGGIFATTDAAATDAIIRTASANVTITDGIFTAADGSSVISIDKNAAHKLIVNVMGGTFVAEDKMVEKVDAQGQIIPGEYDTIEAITFVNNCPTAILVIDPDVLAANPTLDVFNVAAQ